LIITTKLASFSIHDCIHISIQSLAEIEPGAYRTHSSCV